MDNPITSVVEAQEKMQRGIIWAAVACQSLIMLSAMKAQYVPTGLPQLLFVLAMNIVTMIIVNKLDRTNTVETFLDISIYDLLYVLALIISYPIKPNIIYNTLNDIYQFYCLFVAIGICSLLLCTLRDKETGLPLELPPVGVLSWQGQKRRSSPKKTRTQLVWFWLSVGAMVILTISGFDRNWGTVFTFCLVGYYVIFRHATNYKTRVSATILQRNFLEAELIAAKQKLTEFEARLAEIAKERGIRDLPMAWEIYDTEVTPEIRYIINCWSLIHPDYKTHLIECIYAASQEHQEAHQQEKIRLIHTSEQLMQSNDTFRK